MEQEHRSQIGIEAPSASVAMGESKIRQLPLPNLMNQENGMAQEGQSRPSEFDSVARKELRSTSEALTKVEKEIARLEKDRAKLVDRIRHLEALLGKRSASPVEVHTPVESSVSADLVVEILREAGNPMHFRDIYKEFEARGGSMGGKDPANNLLTKYYKDPRLTRVARGTYALADSVSGSRAFSTPSSSTN